jgi:hypothetical protein
LIIEQGNKIYHDEHDIEVSIRNDNTKHVRTCKIKLRADLNTGLTAQDVVKLAKQLYKEAMSEEVKE